MRPFGSRTHKSWPITISGKDNTTSCKWTKTNLQFYYIFPESDREMEMEKEKELHRNGTNNKMAEIGVQRKPIKIEIVACETARNWMGINLLANHWTNWKGHKHNTCTRHYIVQGTQCTWVSECLCVYVEEGGMSGG